MMYEIFVTAAFKLQYSSYNNVFVGMIASEEIINQYYDYINSKDFVCIAAKAAMAQRKIKCMVADHLACPKDDRELLNFLYEFVDEYRRDSKLYQSAAIIFRGPVDVDEPLFDQFLWQRLQALSDLDSKVYKYDKRVSADPTHAHFSFSLKEEAFFIIGLHPANSRLTRRFAYPAIAFNPHAQFEQLREENRYERMKATVRKRDLLISGSVNPMLEDYGQSSEVYQYSGRPYDKAWQCPLNIKHATERHSAA